MRQGFRLFVATGPATVLVFSAICLAYILSPQLPGFSFDALIPAKLSNHLRGSEDKWRLPQPLSFQEATFYADMMVEQKRRRALINKACTAANMSREFDFGPEGKNIFKSVGHLLVDDKYKILFGFIPKIGCTTWKTVMSRLRNTHRGDLDKAARLEKYHENHTAMIHRLQTYRKVLFVREPITRMLSGYLSKLRNFQGLQRTWEHYIGRAIVKRYRGYDHDQRFKDMEFKPWMNITLSEYIQFITDRGSDIKMEVLNDHWLPLHVVSNPCQIHYDFIGHYENLAIEAPFALHWLGIDHVIQFPEVYVSHAANSLVDEYSRVPINLLKRLSSYYGFDYEAFGYHINETISMLVKGVFSENDDDDDDDNDGNVLEDNVNK